MRWGGGEVHSMRIYLGAGLPIAWLGGLACRMQICPGGGLKTSPFALSIRKRSFQSCNLTTIQGRRQISGNSPMQCTSYNQIHGSNLTAKWTETERDGTRSDRIEVTYFSLFNNS